MPTGNWLPVPLVLEQSLATCHLGIVAIAYLEPSCLPRVIRRVLVLGYDALEIELATFLKERTPELSM
jgi:hypothetical protein